MGKFFQNWWQELVLLLLGAVLFSLGVGLDVAKGLSAADVGSVLAAFISLTAAFVSLGNKVELHRQLREHEQDAKALFATQVERALAETVRRVETRIQTFEFLNGRRVNFDMASQLIQELTKELPTPTRLLLTDFGKDLRTSSPPEEQLLKDWAAFIQAGGYVCQIFHYAPLPEAIAQIRAESSRFLEGQNYQIGVTLGQTFLPYIDLLVVEGRAALLTTSDDPSNPTVASSALLFQDTQTVKFLEKAFWVMWKHEDVKIVRGLGGEIRENTIQGIEKFIIESQRTPLELGMPANYEVALRLINEAPPGSAVSITGIGRPKPKEQELEKDNYNTERDKRIAKGDCYIRRVVAICDAHDVKGLGVHLERCKPGKNYELRVLRGASSITRNQPFFDTLIVEGKEALLEVPGMESGHRRLSAFHHADIASLDVLQKYFEALWNIALPFKSEEEKIDDKFLRTWRKRLSDIPVQYGGIQPIGGREKKQP